MPFDDLGILLGDILNFASLLAAFISNNGNAPKFLTIWVSIVVRLFHDHLVVTKLTIPSSDVRSFGIVLISPRIPIRFSRLSMFYP